MKTSFIKFLPIIAALSEQGKITDNEPILPERNYGAYGYTGFTGSNADKKRHFNKKRHGRMLKRKHKRNL